MIPKTIIHLLSGGLDSVTMLYDLRQQGHNVHCLLFDYKQRHVQELTFAKGHCLRLGVLYTTMELPALGGLTDETHWLESCERLGCESVDGTGWFRDPSRPDKVPMLERFIEGHRKNRTPELAWGEAV